MIMVSISDTVSTEITYFTILSYFIQFHCGLLYWTHFYYQDDSCHSGKSRKSTDDV